ncbi:3-oxoacyl-ACP synthase [Aquimarina aquimarini]|uniref:3-oxoacyl-ACP synthase n=1 Tax=Aquimarina aquimarini TaxID=1191734 RepID=UPI000D550A0F|nr:3-oxoacyl-ACP synthase [Aquimarina aquimarini]
MKSEFRIKSFCHVKNNTISFNGSVIYENLESPDFLAFAKAAYRNFDIKYSKFFKMDGLSKLALLASDVILKNEHLDSQKENNIAIVFSNKSSSLDTDRKHQSSIEDADNYYPSPAIFVYTLPNICIGEISIKYKLHSENSFFIFDSFNAEHLLNYSNSLLSIGKADEVLCGWVEYNGTTYEAFMYLVSKEGITQHTKQDIIKLYTI